MDTSPVWNPVPGWPYYTDDTLQPDDPAALPVVAPLDTHKDGVDASIRPNINMSRNTTYSLSSQSPPGSCVTSMSGYSVDSSYFETNPLANLPSDVSQQQPGPVSPPDGSMWSPSELLPSKSQQSYTQGDYRQARNSSIGYSGWQPEASSYASEDCNPRSYGSILEELDQMDTSMLADEVMTFGDPPYSYTYPPDHVQDAETQSLHSASGTSTSLESSGEVSLPISPPFSQISDDEKKPIALQAKTTSRSCLPKKSTRTPHSAVEKKYRSNLQAKFLDLQQCVPALREETDEEKESESRTATAGGPRKVVVLQKGVILSGAVDHIRALSARTSELETKNEHLERRLAVLQKIALQKTKGANPDPKAVDRKRGKVLEVAKPISPPYRNAEVLQVSSRAPKSLVTNFDQAGLTKTLKRALSKSGRDAPDVRALPDKPSLKKRRKISRSELAKVAVSSLVGLALWEGYSESEIPDSVPNSRGLFALPVRLVTLSIRHLLASLPGAERYFHHTTSVNVWAILKIILIIGIALYALSPIVLATLRWTKEKERDVAVIRRSSISPVPLTVEFCQKAWLTAVQSIRIPSHGVVLEALALALKTWKLLLRRVFGWQVYSALTGATLESEIARIKAWDIAVDAQLAGGDPNADFRRLLLTLLASMTIQDTPMRLLRKALHVRLIFWNFSNTKIGYWMGTGLVARSLADHYWLKARALHESVQELRSGPHDGMQTMDVPPHILQLMRQGSNEVLVDSIVIRASHVARNELWDCPEITADEGMDAVFDDVTIRSPLDALAALYSSLTLRNALLNTLKNESHDKGQTTLTNALQLALVTAPPGSRAGMRARAAQAVFLETERISAIDAALKEMPKRHDNDTANFHFVEPAIASICTTNVRIALRSAALIVSVTGDNSSHCLPLRRTRVDMIGIIERMLRSTDVTILGFASALRAAKDCYADTDLRIKAGSELRLLMSRLGLVADSEWSAKYGVDRDTIKFGCGFVASVS